MLIKVRIEDPGVEGDAGDAPQVAEELEGRLLFPGSHPMKVGLGEAQQPGQGVLTEPESCAVFRAPLVEGRAVERVGVPRGFGHGWPLSYRLAQGRQQRPRSLGGHGKAITLGHDPEAIWTA